jgi:hypothetical protein
MKYFVLFADKHLKGILMHFLASDLSGSPSANGASFLRKNLPAAQNISPGKQHLFTKSLSEIYT